MRRPTKAQLHQFFVGIAMALVSWLVVGLLLIIYGCTYVTVTTGDVHLHVKLENER